MYYYTNFKARKNVHGGINNNNVDTFLKHNLIKIPDIYHVEMKFESLLPANFNNLLYTYTCNDKITQITNDNIYQNGLYDSTIIDAATTGFSNSIANYINEQKEKQK